MDILKILSIDIGIINLGYVYAEIYSNDIHVIECNKIDITCMKHSKIHREECTLHHEHCIPDYLDHFVQEHSHFFEEADLILIERQPPVGITNVQDLLFTKFRNKVNLVSPSTIHKYFKMTRCDYDLRKIQSYNLSKIYLENFQNFINHERKHDMSDAMLMIVYYFLKFKKVSKKEVVDFEQFRLIK